MKAAITAIGGFVPNTILSNADLEKLVDTNDEWIQDRTGIKERRILKDPTQATSYLAIQAAQDLIKKQQLNPAEIDALILCTITPDYGVASTAPMVATAIKAYNAFAYDLSAACSGFLYGYSMATALISSGRYKKVLLIGADKMSSIIDYTDRNTCILFGDGAAAVLLEPNKNQGFISEVLHSDGAGSEYLRSEYGGSLHPMTIDALQNKKHFFRQEGRQVFKNAVNSMAAVVQELLQKNNLTIADINWVVPHQANIRIIDAMANLVQIPKEKILCNIERYGNTTDATVPLVLWDYESKFKLGDTIIFVTFGGGFTWGATLLTWAYN